ncbi:hypothetical protein GRZ55_10915 [Chelativorans sp. ZYF759]|uniref:hypothetical protein n=1 Tax=Chelativorans sp. ZYF759 TaxID=2692213 RepID=UPI00145FBF77|nr:hypothetical protein [Chelativorans sp. ZYF759]NMG39753.1 hypothetical protein [Chelativorans sp. ZYF759]
MLNTIRLMLGLKPKAPPRPYIPSRPRHRAEEPQPLAPEVELHRRVLALPIRPRQAWERWLAGNGVEPSLAVFEAWQADHHHRARTFPCRFTPAVIPLDALPDLTPREQTSLAAWCIHQGCPMDRHALSAWRADEAMTRRLMHLPAKALGGSK